MPHTRLAVLTLAAGVLVATGCGGSTNGSTNSTNAPSQTAKTAAAQLPATTKSSPSSSPLPRAQFIAKADTICYAVNARRASTTIDKAEPYEKVVPALAAYEHSAVEEMLKLVPPPSMANGWKQIVEDAQTVAEVTSTYHTYAEASSEKTKPLATILTNAIHRMVTVAKREGLKDCAQFS
jgi:hypothetical protein